MALQTLIGLNKMPCEFSSTLKRCVFNLAPMFSEKQDPIKNRLSNDVSYSDIRFMLAYKINESK